MDDLPRFKYHPDPVQSGVVKKSGAVCVSCSRARGWIYTGPVYAKDELDRRLCPWCIADGSAAQRFDASFGDVEGLAGQVAADVLDEVLHRTPGYVTWQGNGGNRTAGTLASVMAISPGAISNSSTKRRRPICEPSFNSKPRVGHDSSSRIDQAGSPRSTSSSAVTAARGNTTSTTRERAEVAARASGARDRAGHSGMLTIEFEPPSESRPCECCGGRTTRLTRFVHRDGDAYAVYYAQFSDNHPTRGVIATISIGEWGEGSTPHQRVAFALELRATDTEYQVGIVDAERSPWRDAAVIGRTLDRAEALLHPRLSEVFHITDHIVAEDEPIRAYLGAR